jgi:hypothetical protein
MKPKFIFSLLVLTGLLAACGSSATPTPDLNAMNTAIVGTTVAQLSGQFTQTAQAAPTNTPASTEAVATIPTVALPTLANSGPNATVNPAALPTFSFVNTPVVGNTLAAGATALVTPIPNTSSGQPSTAFGCNDGLFIGENLPDGSVIKSGADFAKSWEIKNTGTCTWDEGYSFTFLSNVSSSEIKGYDIVIKAADEFTKPGHSQSFIVKLTAPTKAGEYKGYWKMQDDSGNYFGPRVYFDIVVK